MTVNEREAIRPRGTVEVPCSGHNCKGEWYFWVDALDPRLPFGPFVCGTCAAGKVFRVVADSTDADRYRLECGHSTARCADEPPAFAVVCEECSASARGGN